MQSNRRKILTVLFAVYAAGMLWLMLFNGRAPARGDYFEQMQLQLCLKPFSNIRKYFDLMGSRYRIYRVFAVTNLFGNIFLFSPLGWFIPLLFPRLHSRKGVLLATAGIITVLELTQLFTLRGSCDIDDLILNSLGAQIGFHLLLLAEWIRKRRQSTL